jgi:hypothetical protein
MAGFVLSTLLIILAVRWLFVKADAGYHRPISLATRARMNKTTTTLIRLAIFIIFYFPAVG